MYICSKCFKNKIDFKITTYYVVLRNKILTSGDSVHVVDHVSGVRPRCGKSCTIMCTLQMNDGMYSVYEL